MHIDRPRDHKLRDLSSRQTIDSRKFQTRRLYLAPITTLSAAAGRVVQHMYEQLGTTAESTLHSDHVFSDPVSWELSSCRRLRLQLLVCHARWYKLYMSALINHHLTANVARSSSPRSGLWTCGHGRHGADIGGPTCHRLFGGAQTGCQQTPLPLGARLPSHRAFPHAPLGCSFSDDQAIFSQG